LTWIIGRQATIAAARPSWHFLASLRRLLGLLPDAELGSAFFLDRLAAETGRDPRPSAADQNREASELGVE